MIEAALACAFLLIFVGCSAIGTLFHARLAERQKSKEALESVRLIVTIVVTFSALVLGLLVTSAKEDFDSQTELYQKYGIALSELNWRLVEYGPQTSPIRDLLRSYTAAVFVKTWPGEPHPPGDYPTRLTPVTSGSDEMAETSALIVRMDDALEHLLPMNAYQQRIVSKLQDEIHKVEDNRWHVVERTQSKISPIFLTILVTWLAVVFFTFGLVSLNTAIVHVTVFLVAFSVATSLYLILDLDTALGGFITISSRPFQDALWHMDHSVGP